jgi:hypothetical protein
MKKSIKGEDLAWNREDLGITNRAWNTVIHRGIKPVRVFAHPEVLIQNPKRIGYYRMLATVSQKLMSRVGLSILRYEEGKGLRDFAPKAGESADFSSKVKMRERFKYN